MRIGILSMQRICNYGSFLQAFALYNIIKGLNHRVEFVDYQIGKPLFRDRSDKYKYYKNLFLKKGFNYLSNFSIARRFSPNDIRAMLESKHNYDSKYLPLLNIGMKRQYHSKVDVLVIGSDEVFNCTQLNPDVGFSLDLFGKDNQAKRVVTYAASFGNTTLADLKELRINEEIASYLKRIDFFSVRDYNTADIIYQLTGRKVSFNLDPVLVFDFDKFVPKVVKENNYVLVYAYRNRIKDDEKNFIISFAQKRKLQIITIGGVQSFGNKRFQGNPFEVLDYFRNAKFVFTDTFHGTIFSVINHKQFVTFVRKGHGKEYGNQEKLTDLLERLGLSNRIVNSLDCTENVMLSQIDYANVDIIRQTERKRTIEYLESCFT